MPGLLIHDGYTLGHAIPAQGAFPELKFRYRPALPEKVNEWRFADRRTARDEVEARVKLLDGCVVSWDLRETLRVAKQVLGLRECERLYKDRGDDDVVDVPVMPSSLAALPDPVLNELFNVVTGYGTKQREADLKN